MALNVATLGFQNSRQAPLKGASWTSKSSIRHVPSDDDNVTGELLNSIRHTVARCDDQLRTVIDAMGSIVKPPQDNTEDILQIRTLDLELESKQWWGQLALSAVSAMVAAGKLVSFHDHISLRSVGDLKPWATQGQALWEEYINAWCPQWEGCTVSILSQSSPKSCKQVSTEARVTANGAREDPAHSPDLAYVYKKPLRRLRSLRCLFYDFCAAFPDHSAADEIATTWFNLSRTWNMSDWTEGISADNAARVAADDHSSHGLIQAQESKPKLRQNWCRTSIHATTRLVHDNATVDGSYISTYAGHRSVDTTRSKASSSNGCFGAGGQHPSIATEEDMGITARIWISSAQSAWKALNDEDYLLAVSPGQLRASLISCSEPARYASPTRDVHRVGVTGEKDQQNVWFQLMPDTSVSMKAPLSLVMSSSGNASWPQNIEKIMFHLKSAADCKSLCDNIRRAQFSNASLAVQPRNRVKGRTCAPLRLNLQHHGFERHEVVPEKGHKPQSCSSLCPTTPSRVQGPKEGNHRSFARPLNESRNCDDSSSTAMFQALQASTEHPWPSVSNVVPPRIDIKTAQAHAAWVAPDASAMRQASADDIAADDGPMVQQMSIKFHIRVVRKWKPLGPCLLTIFPATKYTNSTSMQGKAPRIHPPQVTSWRIFITRSSNDSAPLLDETLDASSFRKNMQVGIAFNVWSKEAGIPDCGGVLTRRGTVYMMQFKTKGDAKQVSKVCCIS